MASTIVRLRLLGPLPFLVLGLAPTAGAGDHFRAPRLVPIYAQPAAPPFVYAQAPAAYAAPAAYSAPTAYPAPASYAMQAPAAAGNAPAMVAGGRIKAVDRADIIDELHKEAKDGAIDGTRRERRKALRESATAKFVEAIGEGAEPLNEGEKQDVENIVGSIIDGDSAGKAAQATAPTPGLVYGPAPAPVPYAPALAPAGLAPVQFYQPMIPVQVWVPVQRKHALFHH